MSYIGNNGFAFSNLFSSSLSIAFNCLAIRINPISMIARIKAKSTIEKVEYQFRYSFAYPAEAEPPDLPRLDIVIYNVNCVADTRFQQCDIHTVKPAIVVKM